MLTRIVFLQIGLVPSHRGHAGTVPLTASYWMLTGYRTVQYIQTDTQRGRVRTRQERLAENAKRAAEKETELK
jgi:hypothetical protein